MYKYTYLLNENTGRTLMIFNDFESAALAQSFHYGSYIKEERIRTGGLDYGLSIDSSTFSTIRGDQE